MRVKRSQVLIRGLLYSSTGTAVEYLARFAFLVIAARFVAPDEFGLIASFAIANTLVQMWFTEGIGSAIVQKTHLTRRLFHFVSLGCVLGGIISTSLVYLAAPLFAAAFGSDEATSILRQLAIVTGLQIATVGASSFLRRYERYRTLAVLSTTSYVLVHFPVAIICLLFGYGLTALVVALIAQSVSTAIALWYLVPLPRPRHWRIPKPAIVKQFLRLSTVLFGTGFVNSLALRIDNFIVLRGLGLDALGFYGRAYNLSTLPSSLLGKALSTVLLPFYSRNKSDHAAAKLGMLTAYRSILTLSAVVLPFVFLFSQEIVVVLLGETWLPAASALAFLLPVSALRLLAKFPSAILTARGVLRPQFFGQLIYTFSLVVFGTGLLRFGIDGVAIGTSISVLLLFVFVTVLAAQDLQLRLSDLLPIFVRASWIIVVASAATLSLRYLCQQRGFDAAIALVLASSIYFLLCLPLLWLIRSDVVPVRVRKAFART